jgi:uncharacterized protein with HEPN domain
LSDSKSPIRLQKIIESIDAITFILEDIKIRPTQAIEDRLIKPALRMHIVKTAEQFNKLKEENAFEILSRFEDRDLRGLAAVRNFIAHDYDSTDDSIIEDIIRYDLPRIRENAVKILEEMKETKR